MTELLYDILKQHSELMQNKEKDLVKQKLCEKGFSHIAKNLSLLPTPRFVGLCRIQEGKWKYYYADNKTLNGCFIVAIRECEREFDKGKDAFNSVKATIAFDWHEREPEHLKIPNLVK